MTTMHRVLLALGSITLSFHTSPCQAGRPIDLSGVIATVHALQTQISSNAQQPSQSSSGCWSDGRPRYADPSYFGGAGYNNQHTVEGYEQGKREAAARALAQRNAQERAERAAEIAEQKRVQQAIVEAERQEKLRVKREYDAEVKGVVDKALDGKGSFFDENGGGRAPSSATPKTRDRVGADGLMLEGPPAKDNGQGGGTPESGFMGKAMEKLKVGSVGFMQKSPAKKINGQILDSEGTPLSASDLEEGREMAAQQRADLKSATRNIWKNGSKDPWGDFGKALDQYNGDTGTRAEENGLTGLDPIQSTQSTRPVILPNGTPSTFGEQQKMGDNEWFRLIGSPFAK